MGDKEHVQAELRKRILHSKGLLKKKKKIGRAKNSKLGQPSIHGLNWEKRYLE